MTERSWHMDDGVVDVPSSPTGQHFLVNLHFMRSALRRRWLVWVAAGCIGMEAVMLLQESVGIDDETRVLFRDRLADISPGAHRGQVLFGLILGLIAARLDAGWFESLGDYTPGPAGYRFIAGEWQWGLVLLAWAVAALTAGVLALRTRDV